MNRFYFEEYKASIITVLIGILAISIFGFLAFFDSESGTTTHLTVEAKIINYSRTRSSTGMFNYVFVAELNNGLKINIDDIGVIPISYRGPVLLDAKKGNITGKNNYTINQKSIDYIQLKNLTN